MLQLKSAVSQNQGGTELYIEMVTATGVYDATTNPGGFGSPNPVRNSVALIFYGNNKKSAGDVLQSPDAYDPATVTSFTIQITNDNNGILEYFVWALPIFDDMLVYVDDDIVYDQENPAAPFIKKMIASVWTPILPIDLITETIEGTLEDVAFFFPRAIAFRDELNVARLRINRKLQAGDATDLDYDTSKTNFDLVEGLLDIASKAFCGGAFNEAQLRLEEVLTLQDTIATANG